MFNIDKIKKAIEDLDDSDKMALWNDYCTANSYDNIIEDNEPNIIMCSWDAETILRRVDLEGNYRLNDRYCTTNGWSEYVSFDYIDDDNSPFDLDSVAKWIYRNEDACGYLDEDDITDHFNYNSFVDSEMDNDDVEQFLISNDVSFNEDDDEITRADLVKDYLEDLGDDVDEITEALDDLGWSCDIEERVLQYFN